MKGLLLLLLLVAFAAAKVSYEGHQLWRIHNNDDAGPDLLNNVINGFNLDVWSHTKSSIDVRVSPEMIRRVRVALAGYRFTHETIIPDIGAILKTEEERMGQQSRAFSLTQYNTFEDVVTYLNDVATTSSYATLITLGQSVEGRDLLQLKISVGTGKPSVWIDCNIHAREWITGATCLYGIDLLTNSYGSDPDVTTLLDTYDVYILAINNPDGYSFTWSDDRLWRKNRNKYVADTCYGIDLNRNFDDHFGGEGTSASSCTETYRGPSAASEPETQIVQNGILDLLTNADLRVLFSIHSYSQLWMYPYGWTSDPCPDDAELARVSDIGVAALTAVHGTAYVSGPVSTTIYPAASTTIDYSYAQGVTYSFTLELRDTGTYGFLLPEDQITPVGEETWAGLIAAILAVP